MADVLRTSQKVSVLPVDTGEEWDKNEQRFRAQVRAIVSEFNERIEALANAAPSPLTDLSDVTIAAATQGQVLARGATEFQNLTMITLTLGPYFANDVAATITTQMGQMYFDFSTTVKREGVIEVRMDRPGRIVGCILTSDAARTAGTATFRPRINGVGADFAAGAVQLNGTTTTGDSAFVAYVNGIPFAAGATIGAEVVTVGWAPTTANMNAKIIVMLEPF